MMNRKVINYYKGKQYGFDFCVVQFSKMDKEMF